jgi:hypothetical protein
MGVALVLVGLALVAFSGLSLLVGRRLPPPLNMEAAAAAHLDWYGAAAGVLLLLGGAALAIVADARRTRQLSRPSAPLPERVACAVRPLPQAGQKCPVKQQPDRVDVQRRIPVPRATVKEV